MINIKIIKSSLVEKKYSLSVNGRFKGFYYAGEIMIFLDTLKDFTIDSRLKENDKLYLMLKEKGLV